MSIESVAETFDAEHALTADELIGPLAVTCVFKFGCPFKRKCPEVCAGEFYPDTMPESIAAAGNCALAGEELLIGD